VEEAELFSNSIAPLFEARDVDRLQAQPDANGMLRLDVRNEAMETHYINHLQLFEVQHAGARSIDWLGTGLGHVSAAVEMGRWYERLAGLHVSVFRDGAYREVTFRKSGQDYGRPSMRLSATRCDCAYRNFQRASVGRKRGHAEGDPRGV
jgi:hypothetical protein